MKTIYWKTDRSEFVIRPGFKSDDNRVYRLAGSRWRLATQFELSAEIERLLGRLDTLGGLSQRIEG
jgi:hypothetical protein